MKLIGDKEARTELYYRYSKLSDTPLLVLAIFMIPLLVLPEVVALTTEQDGMI